MSSRVEPSSVYCHAIVCVSSMHWPQGASSSSIILESIDDRTAPAYAIPSCKLHQHMLYQAVNCAGICCIKSQIAPAYAVWSCKLHWHMQYQVANCAGYSHIIKISNLVITRNCCKCSLSFFYGEFALVLQFPPQAALSCLPSLWLRGCNIPPTSCCHLDCSLSLFWNFCITDQHFAIVWLW